MSALQKCVFNELVSWISSSSELSESLTILTHTRNKDACIKSALFGWGDRLIISVLCGIDPSVDCSFWYGGFHYSRLDFQDNPTPELGHLLMLMRDKLFQKERIMATSVEILVLTRVAGETEFSAVKHPYSGLDSARELIWRAVASSRALDNSSSKELSSS